jgi:methionyl-tRNA synthetase
VIGKDITRFHAIYWPAFLMSAGLPVPRQIVVHGFLFNRGEKMSKSVGNVVSPADLVASYGLDPVRYFFLREVPFGQDGNYSHEAIVNRMNADLANDIGNLAQRSLSMIARNCASAVPDPQGAMPAPEDLALLARSDALVGEARRHMASFLIHLYVAAVFDLVAETNRYFANAEPWKLARSDPARMRLVLYVTIEALRVSAILLQPVMPGSMGKLLDLLGVPAGRRSFASLEAGDARGLLGAPHRLEPGAALPAPSPIFPRYVEPEAAK